MQEASNKKQIVSAADDKPIVLPFQDEISEARAIQQAEQFIGEGCFHVI